MRRLKSMILFLSAVMILVGSSSIVDAKEVRTLKPKKLINEHKIQVLDEIVTVNEYDDNGVKVYTVSDKVKDRVAVANIVKQYFSKGRATNHEKDCTKKTKTGYGSNTYARNTTEATGCFWTENNIITGPIRYHSVVGEQETRWAAGSPVNADTIVVHQSTEFTGVGMTISWPPSWNPVSNKATWSSQPISDAWLVFTDRYYVEGKRTTSVSISDSSDIYVGAHIYRASSSLSWSY